MNKNICAIFPHVQCSGCKRRTRKKETKKEQSIKWVFKIFNAYVPGLRLPMCISETIIFIDWYVYISLFLSLFIHYSFSIKMGIRHKTWGKGARATAIFLSLALFFSSFEFWWNRMITIFSSWKYRILAFIIESASERQKKPQKFPVLSFINQYGFIHLDRISWKPNDIVRANKLNLYFIQKTIWP